MRRRGSSRLIAPPTIRPMVRRIWRRLGPLRVLGYGTLTLTIIGLVGLEQFAAPCVDLLDGPCEHNWASEAQSMILLLLLLAMIVSLCLAVWDLGSLVLRRWRREPR
jgi:hypothetical protein